MTTPVPLHRPRLLVELTLLGLVAAMLTFVACACLATFARDSDTMK